jgi:hypothetical protein
MDDFSVIPSSGFGRVGLAMAVGGFLLFMAAVVSRPISGALAAPVAVGSMLIIFAGGMIRAYTK